MNRRMLETGQLENRLVDALEENLLVIEVVDPYGTSKFFETAKVRISNSTVYLEVDLRGIYERGTEHLSGFRPTETASGSDRDSVHATGVQGERPNGSEPSSTLDRIGLGEAGRLS